jgi:hypothetical protein
LQLDIFPKDGKRLLSKESVIEPMKCDIIQYDMGSEQKNCQIKIVCDEKDYSYRGISAYF